MKTGTNLIALLLTMPLICVAHGGRLAKADEEIPTASYCDLLRRPEKFDKQTVRMTVLYVRGFEVSALEDSECDPERSTWVEFDPAFRQSTKKEIQRKFDRVFYPSRQSKKGVIAIPGPHRAELTVVGQFNGPKPGVRVGPEGKRMLTGYGHLNGFKYQFIIKRIEQVQPRLGNRTAEANRSEAQSQQVSRGGCTVIDRTKASVFLVIDPESPPIEDRMLRLFNNHSCDIILQTTGTHTLLLPDGRIQVSGEEEIADNAIVNLLFRANTRDRPWEFQIRWKGGDASS